MESTHLTDALLQDYPERSVWTTWAISYQAIYDKHEHTAKLLLLWSFLDNKNLWYGLLAEASSYSEVVGTILSRWIGKIATSELAFSQAMQLLRNYSLVEEVKETTGYATHPVVHRWAYHYQGKQFKLELSQLATIVVGFAAPDEARPDFSTLQRWLLPHAHACSQWLLRKGEEQGNETTDGHKQSERSRIGLRDIEEREKLLNATLSLGNLYANQSKLVEAEQMYKLAVQGYEKAFGPTYLSRLDTINNLGIIYREQGKLVESEQMYKQALQGHKEAFRPTHPSRLGIVNNLGNLYLSQGKLAEAEQMYKQALQGHKEAFRPTHPSRLGIVNNLGIIYREQGRLVESEQMYKQALQGYTEAFGPTHLSRLSVINNLGSLYLGQGKLAEAEQMYTQALYRYKETLGDTQVRTYKPAVDLLYNIGLLYENQKDYAKAQEMYRDALSGYQAILGPSHHQCLKLSAEIDEISARLQAMGEDSGSGLSTKPGIAGLSNEDNTYVNDTSQDATDKKGKKSFRTRFRRLADKFR
jgi:tetratricopeptide (TPR) repeat protein